VCTRETASVVVFFVTSCLRYISGKYYPNWSGFNGVIAEVKEVTFFEPQCRDGRSVDSSEPLR